MVGLLTCREASRYSVEEIANHFKVDPECGLLPVDALCRKPIFSIDDTTKRVKQKVKNPRILLLIVLVVVCVFVRQDWEDISIIWATVMVSAVTVLQVHEQEKALECLTNLGSSTNRCRRNRCTKQISARELVPGDVVELSVGERVPADLRLIQAIDLATDESSVKGETVFNTKNMAAQLDTTPMSNNAYSWTSNITFMGTKVVRGRGQGIVIGTVNICKYSEQFKMVQWDLPQTDLQKKIDVLCSLVSYVFYVTIHSVVFLGWFQGQTFLDMFILGISLVGVAIPMNLPTTVTVLVAHCVMQMKERSAQVNKLPIVERKGSANEMCLDKSSTLANNELAATNINAADLVEMNKIVVGLTSDSTGDAMALKAADIRISMDKLGTDVSKEPEAMDPQDDDLTAILNAIEEDTPMMNNICCLVRFHLSMSVTVLSLVALSLLFGLAVPFTITHLWLVNFVMNVLLVKSCYDKPLITDPICKPVPGANNRFFTKTFIQHTLIEVAVIVIGIAWFFWKEMQTKKITPRESTVTLSCVLLFSALNMFMCRMQERPVIMAGLMTMKQFLYEIVGALIIQLLIVFISPLQVMFQMEARYFSDFLFPISLVSAVFLVLEVWKFIRQYL